MKNLMFAGLGAGAVVGLALGYLFATKRVVLIVAPKSSEITVNENGEGPAPAPKPRVATVQAAAPAPAVVVPPKPVAVPAPAPVPDEAPEPPAVAQAPQAEAEPAYDPSASDDPLVRAIAERDAAFERERVALAEKTEAPKAEEEESKPEEPKEDDKKKKKKERPVVVYDGIGRLGHVALTNVAKVKTKRGKQETQEPSTYYPHGQTEFDEPTFARVIKNTDSEILSCYRSARRYNPSLQGTVMAEMTVTPAGTIAAAEVTDSSLSHSGVEECVKRLVTDLTFPKGVTSRPARVTYSWRLMPDAS